MSENGLNCCSQWKGDLNFVQKNGWPLKGPLNDCIKRQPLNWIVQVPMTTPYLELVYLVTALVPSETACLANSPGNRSRTAVWISREVMVDLLL